MVFTVFPCGLLAYSIICSIHPNGAERMKVDFRLVWVYITSEPGDVDGTKLILTDKF